jgi:Fibronectin type III domain
MGLALPRSCVLVAAVAFLAIVSPSAFAASDPVNLVQTPVSDRAVELTWNWPAVPAYPAELDVYRDGDLVTSVSSNATSFLDTGLAPQSQHYYQLKADSNALTPAVPSYVTTRADHPTAPTNVGAIFSSSNVATVTWQRGDSDSDVTYQVVATPVSGSAIPLTARFGIGDNSPGSLTMVGFSSYTLYTFTVDAVEDSGSGDPGGTVAGDGSVTKRSNDVLTPQWPNGGAVSGSRLSLGTITATWPTGSDSGTGLASYAVCVDIVSCSTVPVGGGATQTASIGSAAIRNDGLSHSLSVVAVDGAGNQSVPLTTSVLMPVLAAPVISLTGGNGCLPLVAHATSPDLGATAHLFIDGGPPTETPLDQEITGTPYQQLTLVANATFGPDTSAISGPTVARVYDPNAPDTSPAVHPKVDVNTNSAILSWDPITKPSGAPIIGYEVTIATLPGYENGSFVEQSANPTVTLTGLQSQSYLVQVTAVDGCFRQSPPVANPPRFLLSDIESPTAPGLAVPVTGGHDVRLSWTPSTDNVAVDDYKVFQNGILLTRTDKTTYDVTGLPDAWSANYTVVAMDTAGNASPSSVTRTATTKDVTPPVFLGNVSYSVALGANVTLKWSAATDVVGVSVYQITRDGTPVANVTGTSWLDKNVPAGNHHWDIQAFDAAGNGSILHGTDAYSSGPPKTTVASALRVVNSKGAKAVTVGGASGTRIVLSFDLAQVYARGSLRLQVVKSTLKKLDGQSKTTIKTKVRISLPAGTGRTTAGKRLGERLAKKGTVTIPLGRLPAGPLKLVVTATGGTVTISGTGAGPKAPTIAPSS